MSQPKKLKPENRRKRGRTSLPDGDSRAKLTIRNMLTVWVFRAKSNLCRGGSELSQGIRMTHPLQTIGVRALSLLAALFLAACGTTSTPSPQPSSFSAAPTSASADPVYVLGAGDELRVIVFGENDLSGSFEVDGQGMVAMPLVGQVQAGGLSLREFEETFEAVLKEGYLLDPRVSAEVANFRPFYIIGEINNGGEFPFTDGMSVLNAVAVAGGYSYRADRRKVKITRITNGQEQEIEAGPSSNVMPGDVIRVLERFF